MPENFEFSFSHPVHGEELLDGTGTLARTSWLAKRLRDDDIFFMQDGALSQLLFKEVLSSFLAGLDIATIVLAFSLIERTIAGRLATVRDGLSERATSEALIDRALEREWLTPDEHKSLNELRAVRNPIVHFRDSLSDTRPEIRAVLSAKTTDRLLEEDAKNILDAALHVLRKTAL